MCISSFDVDGNRFKITFGHKSFRYSSNKLHLPIFWDARMEKQLMSDAGYQTVLQFFVLLKNYILKVPSLSRNVFWLQLRVSN